MRRTLDPDAAHGVLADVEVGGHGVEQVAHALHVNLHVRHAQRELARVGRRLDGADYGVDDARRDARLVARARHRKRLARARLPVRHECDVDAAERGVDERQRRLLKYELLRRLAAKHGVKGVGRRAVHGAHRAADAAWGEEEGQ